MVTRSQINSLKPKQFPDHRLFYSTKHPLQALPAITIPSEPTNYSQEVEDNNWCDAMQAEFNALLRNKTWILYHVLHPRKWLRTNGN